VDAIILLYLATFLIPCSTPTRLSCSINGFSVLQSTEFFVVGVLSRRWVLSFEEAIACQISEFRS
jgi:hypothetical protein